MSVQHYENFPVASVLCPPELRPAVVAIYRFARTADDIADEGKASASQRHLDLASFRADLRALASDPSAASARWPEVFAPLSSVIQRFGLPTPLLEDLLSAFEQDVTQPIYPDRAALLDYCRRSANPIGRLLLHLYGVDDPSSLQHSDAICTALQLINFWQDLSVDLPRGRCYVPLEDTHRHGLNHPAQLLQHAGSDAARHLVADLTGWARQTMNQGSGLTKQLPGRAGWELRLVVQGGLRILDKIEEMHHDTLRTRPKLTALDLAPLLWRALRM